MPPSIEVHSEDPNGPTQMRFLMNDVTSGSILARRRPSNDNRPTIVRMHSLARAYMDAYQKVVSPTARLKIINNSANDVALVPSDALDYNSR